MSFFGSGKSFPDQMPTLPSILNGTNTALREFTRRSRGRRLQAGVRRRGAQKYGGVGISTTKSQTRLKTRSVSSTVSRGHRRARPRAGAAAARRARAATRAIGLGELRGLAAREQLRLDLLARERDGRADRGGGGVGRLGDGEQEEVCGVEA